MKRFRQWIRREEPEESGQAVVEFALCVPLLLLLLCGILDFGWIYMNQYKVDYAAFSGARYGAIYAADEEISEEDLSEGVRNRALANLYGGGRGATVTLEVEESSVSVTVDYPVRTLTFVASTFFGKYYNASSTSVSSY